jgi:4'-phosphopantetheinyl transferase
MSVVCAYYWSTHALTDAQIVAARHRLSIEERERAERLAIATDRRDFIAAHALLRVMLGTYLGVASDRIDFATDPHGKPMLHGQPDSSPLGISLSHSRGLVACALADDRAVGVDVQPIDGTVDVMTIARRFFAPEEVAALNACVPQQRASRFCEMWTLKEALFKALGLGLGLPLDSASFLVQDDDVPFISRSPLIDAEWSFVVADVAGTHRLAVAAPRAQGIVPAISVIAMNLDLCGQFRDGRDPAARAD